MAERLTIYVGPPVDEALRGIGPGEAGRGGDPESRSGRINAVCERYLATVERDMPELAKGEWCLFCDILNSSFRDRHLIDGLALEVADSEPDGTGEKWAVDVRALALKVDAMTFGQKVAIVEVVDRFWRITGTDYGEMLVAAGARLAPA